MDFITDFTTKAEQVLERISEPVKPLLPVIARFLLVVTFLEDSIRISSQWTDQIGYLQRHQGVNVIVMMIGSILAIAKKHTEIAVAGFNFINEQGLGAVIVSQWIGYGLLFDGNFFLRNLSVAGGLLMLLADGSLSVLTSAYSSKRKQLFAGLPSLNETDKSTYLQLFGRILLVFLFLTFVFSGEFSVLRLIVSVVGLIGCVMVVIGFKAKYTAWILISLLCISNVLLNNWWSLHHAHPRRDFLKYDFFQTLSIMGGFLLLANLGAGSISMDEKKKNF